MSAANDHLMMSVAGYLALDNASPGIRYEYLDGYARLRDGDAMKLTLNEVHNGAHLMQSGGSLNHSLISSETIAFFISALRGSRCRVFTSDARVKLNDSRYVYPDVTISCTARLDDPQNITEPKVVIEVLSPGTAAYDRTKKLQSYRECPSLQAILLIEQDRPLVEVNRRQSEEVWTIQTYGMDKQIILDAIGVTIPVAAIYNSIDDFRS